MQSCGLLFPIVPVAQESAANGEEDGESGGIFMHAGHYADPLLIRP